MFSHAYIFDELLVHESVPCSEVEFAMHAAAAGHRIRGGKRDARGSFRKGLAVEGRDVEKDAWKRFTPEVVAPHKAEGHGPLQNCVPKGGLVLRASTAWP